MPKIYILGVPYNLRMVNKVVDDGVAHSNYAGLCDFMDKDIQIKKKLTKSIHNNTIKHEVYHAVLCEAGFDDYSSDEHLINMLAMQHDNITKVFTKLGVNNV